MYNKIRRSNNKGHKKVQRCRTDTTFSCKPIHYFHPPPSTVDRRGGEVTPPPPPHTLPTPPVHTLGPVGKNVKTRPLTVCWRSLFTVFQYSTGTHSRQWPFGGPHESSPSLLFSRALYKPKNIIYIYGDTLTLGRYLTQTKTRTGCFLLFLQDLLARI